MSVSLEKTQPLTCDMFCRVIDNFGDAGIAWRLAQSLTRENGWQVRLIIDDRKTLAAMVPEVKIDTEPQTVQSVAIDAWENALVGAPADVVIELFSCFLPEDYEAAINAARNAETPKNPVVLALDYLTAERYAEESNGLQSPHPRYGYPKTFLFPGFSEKTCGVIYEAVLADKVRSFKESKRKTEVLKSFGADANHPFTLFFFTYPQPVIEELAKALVDDKRPIQMLCAPGAATEKLISKLETLKDSDHIRVVRMPMVPQAEFDEVLMSCDAALVRGEDSTMRAQLLGVPLIWMLYPQEEDTHLVKLAAFSKIYTEALPCEAREAWASVSEWINGKPDAQSAWSAWRDAFEGMVKGAKMWQETLLSRTSLTVRLTQIVAKQLK
ncbi:MAG: elongation factor P maturation arginine rhamnosyltransferase EarP [Sutterellaceae bacterium]|nr:elongation factor P maturation arginine rhamnosyltransferase EarP [Sutterellaceae bacterium]